MKSKARMIILFTMLVLCPFAIGELLRHFFGPFQDDQLTTPFLGGLSAIPAGIVYAIVCARLASNRKSRGSKVTTFLLMGGIVLASLSLGMMTK